MQVYFDREEQELLTETEMMERINDEIEIQGLYLQEIYAYPESEIWYHLEEDFKSEILNEISNRIEEERFISREFEDEGRY